MDINIIKKLINQRGDEHSTMIEKIKIAERYYKNENDILERGAKAKDAQGEAVRTADNRVPSNFHGLLVNQKSSYLFTSPPLFDVGNKATNQRIADLLGDEYTKNCKDLCINASNAGTAWLHYWVTDSGEFEYAVVPTGQVIPVWSKELKKKLIAVMRLYTDITEDGKTIEVYEYWTDKQFWRFTREEGNDFDSEPVKTFLHDYGEVPYIMFSNNNTKTSDLANIKRLIDAYDLVYSGFLNDLEDIQEIIFVLMGYEGEDLDDFHKKLKKYKTIKVDGSEDSKTGVSTIAIEIPTEARNIMLTWTRKAIFEQGQGIDPDPQNFGNSSGVALKYLYALLDLKSGLMETEFRLAFGRLIRAMCRHIGMEVKGITQTWTRTGVANDLELAEIASKSVGVISQKTILRRHPWVEDPEKEEIQINLEKEEAIKQYGSFESAEPPEGDVDEE